MTQDIKRLLFYLAVSLVGFIIYSNVLDGAFLFDDYSVILANNRIKSIDFFKHWNTWSNINLRPLSLFSFYLNYAFGGLHTLGYHITNVSIHIINAIAVYTLTKLILNSNDSVRKNSDFIPVITAFIFLTHPVQTQSVAYITQRMTSLSALFYLLTCIAYLKMRFLDTTKIYRKLFYSISTVLCFVLAVLSKQHTLTLVFMLPILEIYFLSNSKINFKALVVSFIALISGGLFFVLKGGGFLLKANTDISRIHYLISQLKVALIYLKIVLFPVKLNVDYHLSISESIGWQELLGLLLISVLIIGIVYFFKKNKLYSFAILWVLATISVESSIIPIRDLIFEHRLYLPFFGIALLISLFLERLTQLNRNLKIGIPFLLILGYSSLTYSRNEVWKSPLALWKNTYEKSPQKPRVNINLGHSYLLNNELDSAQKYLEKAVALSPHNIEGLDLLGLCYLQQKKYDLAGYYFKTVNELYPSYIPSHEHLYDLYFEQKKYYLCIKTVQKLRKLQPNNAIYVIKQADTFIAMDKRKNAIKLVTIFLEYHPKNKRAENYLKNKLK